MPGQSSNAPPPPTGSGVPPNVSFSKDSEESAAYQEHNPPAVLRKQEAARREMSPSQAEQQQHHQSPLMGVDARIASPQIPAQGGYPSVQLGGPSGAPLPGNRSAATSVSSLVSRGSVATLPAVPGGLTQPVSGASSTSSPPRIPPTSGVPGDYELHHGIPSKKDEVHILVAVTGSVATIKVPHIINKLKEVYKQRAVIQLVVTKASTVFFDPKDLPKDMNVWYDKDEWRSRQVGGVIDSSIDQQLHIKLRRWADILLVAPCSANTLAKFTYGICDNLLTSIFRVWNPEVPILLAPAMNTHMYTNPVTKRHFQVMKEFYPFVEILKPVEKVLVCGDIGMGGMREWQDIVQILVKRVAVEPEAEDDDEDDDDDSAKSDLEFEDDEDDEESSEGENIMSQMNTCFAIPLRF